MTVVPLPTATRLQVTVVPLPTQPVQAAPTALKVVVLPVDGGGDDNPALHNGRSVKAGRNVLLPGFSQSAVKNPMIFGDSLVFQVEVFDETVGKRDGDGIASVTFSISDESGKVVHQRTETTSRYCVFGGGEPDCAVWQFSKQGDHWPGGAALHYGEHDVQITIKPKKARRQTGPGDSGSRNSNAVEQPAHHRVDLLGVIADQDAVIALAGEEAKEQLPAEGQQRPHEHGVVEADRGRRTLRGVVAPLGRVAGAVRLIELIFVSEVEFLDHCPIPEVAVLKR